MAINGLLLMLWIVSKQSGVRHRTVFLDEIVVGEEELASQRLTRKINYDRVKISALLGVIARLPKIY